MLYRIKPLVWEKLESVAPDLKENHEAHTAFCSFKVEQWASGDWAYRYCFDEYYDEGRGGCKNLEDGKAKCEKIWIDKLKKCLIEATIEGGIK